MSAPGKTAPLASLTVPLICAVACPQALTQPRTKISSTIAEYFARHFIDSSPMVQLFEKQWRQFIQTEDSDQHLGGSFFCRAGLRLRRRTRGMGRLRDGSIPLLENGGEWTR